MICCVLGCGVGAISRRGSVEFFFLAITLVQPEKMVRRFKIDDEQFFMLTYPTTPDDFPIDDLVGILDGLGCNYRIGRELHEDGKPHFHAMVVFDNPYSDRDGRTTFRVGGRAPNIRMRRTKPERGWDYVGKHAGTKDGHYIVAEKGDRPGGDGDSNERSTNDVWHEIILARTRKEFFDLASRLAPRQLACSFSQLTAYADWKYRVVETPYASPEGEFEVPIELQQWVNANLRREHHGRYVLPQGPLRSGAGR